LLSPFITTNNFSALFLTITLGFSPISRIIIRAQPASLIYLYLRQYLISAPQIPKTPCILFSLYILYISRITWNRLTQTVRICLART
jgi:hypothetical protein